MLISALFYLSSLYSCVGKGIVLPFTVLVINWAFHWAMPLFHCSGNGECCGGRYALCWMWAHVWIDDKVSIESVSVRTRVARD